MSVCGVCVRGVCVCLFCLCVIRCVYVYICVWVCGVFYPVLGVWFMFILFV